MKKTALIGFAGGLVGAALIFVGQGFELHIRPVGLSYADLAATILSGVAVLTTILGIFLAVLALYGYTALKSSAQKAAKQHVGAQLEQGELRTHLGTIVTEFLLKEFADGNLRKLVEARVDAVIYSGAQERAAEDDEQFDEEVEFDVTTEIVASKADDGVGS